jgi:hypothetical protein
MNGFSGRDPHRHPGDHLNPTSHPRNLEESQGIHRSHIEAELVKRGACSCGKPRDDVFSAS